MPPRRKRRILNVQAAPGLRTHNLQVDSSLVDIDWATLATRLFRQHSKLPLIPRVRLAAWRARAIALHRSFHRQADFVRYYNSLPDTIPKHELLIATAAMQNKHEFARWNNTGGSGGMSERGASSETKTTTTTTTTTTNTTNTTPSPTRVQSGVLLPPTRNHVRVSGLKQSTLLQSGYMQPTRTR